MEQELCAQNIQSWAPEEAQTVFDILEKPNWAPWLAASAETLAGRASVFPGGQLLMRDPDGMPLASLSTNRIQWDGNPSTLPTWDQVAGEPTTYINTYIPVGNTLVLMSMNVHPERQGEGLARRMIEQIKLVAQELGVEHLIGSFRPNQFGQFKAQKGNWDTDFEVYCKMRREDGLPIDGWLRSLTRNGMIPLTVDKNAMTVTVKLQEFYGYTKTYKPPMWKQVVPGIWKCGEVGQWTVDEAKGSAIYIESNLWGRLGF